MINEIKITGPNGSPLRVFPAIKNPYGSDNYICDEVDGIGPVDAQINAVKVGLQPGMEYNSFTLRERIIVLHWRAEGNKTTLEQERIMLRDRMGPGASVTVGIKTAAGGSNVATISGIVQRMRQDIVTRNAEPGIEMEIYCPNPKFRQGGRDINGI